MMMVMSSEQSQHTYEMRGFQNEITVWPLHCCSGGMFYTGFCNEGWHHQSGIRDFSDHIWALLRIPVCLPERQSVPHFLCALDAQWSPCRLSLSPWALGSLLRLRGFSVGGGGRSPPTASRPAGLLQKPGHKVLLLPISHLALADRVHPAVNPAECAARHLSRCHHTLTLWFKTLELPLPGAYQDLPNPDLAFQPHLLFPMTYCRLPLHWPPSTSS